MKVYCLEYDISIPTGGDIFGVSSEVTTEHRVETHADLIEFVKSVRYWSNRSNVSNIKTYCGILSEIPVDKVLNPF